MLLKPLWNRQVIARLNFENAHESKVELGFHEDRLIMFVPNNQKMVDALLKVQLVPEYYYKAQRKVLFFTVLDRIRFYTILGFIVTAINEHNFTHKEVMGCGFFHSYCKKQLKAHLQNDEQLFIVRKILLYDLVDLQNKLI